MEPLGVKVSKGLAAATLRKTAEAGVTNARANVPYIERTILDLQRELGERPPASAVVVAAGPSLHRRNPAATLREEQYAGAVVVCDSALSYCLRNGLVPQYMVTVDPHPYRMIRWLGDPELASRPPDDYFVRQDLDPIHQDEVLANNVTLQLVNKHGPQIKAVISTSVHQSVTQRCLDAGMELYWWNPLYDDYDDPQSYSRKVFELTGAPCMVTGGNVGASAYVFASAVLRAPNIALAGFDLGYAPGTQLRNTQYYYELLEVLGDRAAEALIEIPHPVTAEPWLTDPTYYWYRQCLLDIIAVSDSATYNCTEGGILFGDGITLADLKEFLKDAAALHAGGGRPEWPKSC